MIRANFSVGKIRNLIATSAWGMGIDDPHFQRVIHWKAKGNLDTFIQRFSRCEWDPNRQRLYLLYHGKDCREDRVVTPGGYKGLRSQKRTRYPNNTSSTGLQAGYNQGSVFYRIDIE